MTQANKNPFKLLLPLSLAIAVIFPFGCGKSKGPANTREIPVTSVKEAVPNEPGDPVLGKVVYDNHCHYCHGRAGRGKGPVSISVEPNPANFIKDKKRMAVTDEALFKSISEGISKESGGAKLKKALHMPPFKGVLTIKERWDAIAYIRELVKQSAESGN